ncbi:putative angiotensin-converting enzyme 2 [Tanacetum coccineum]|uniref:Angiotensin-converting enzyme 2 n=1 Tax=Tanacetum coccineum TaxID=301880 RepID=A0ABQ5HG82_9ASTR
MRRVQSHMLPCSHCQSHDHKLPCLHCQPHGFIRMVQNLIERCIIFRMGRDDCMRTLAKHANIDPVVTFTVWEELLKENKFFFQAYSRSVLPSNLFNGKPRETSNGNHIKRTWISLRR